MLLSGPTPSASTFHRERRLVLLAFLGCLALTAGCMRIPLGSLWALKQFSFETFEPSALRVAMRLPAGIALKGESLVVDTKIKREGEPVVEEHFVLRETRDKADLIGLPEVSAAQGRWVVLKFDSNEAQRVLALRQGLQERKAAAERASAPKGKNSLDIGAAPKFCRTKVPLDASAKVSGAMYWAADKGYVMVMRDTRLDEFLKDLDDSKDVGSMPMC